ncbi:leucyl aminopeptidase family protein [Paractinoplanes toevensis]|uniref:Probable cytosol aminopeptidase n=1 Tax=Paractinoplanes toevensis TaxID=571911 RepID=A0A920BPQ3_9ACTN|nr:leucyl aminopeptidase family protein [Actinoplanes toevensis]GIM96001.1 leucyl aminopeptidase [Actinoplanes toevensis]
MFPIRLTDHLDDNRTWVAPIAVSGSLSHDEGELAAEIAALADGMEKAGEIRIFPRPLCRPAKVLLAGIGAGDDAGWRAAGAAVSRAVPGDEPVQIMGVPTDAVRALAEGLWLGGYRYRDGREEPRSAAVDLVVPDPDEDPASLARAQVTARAVWLARDLANTPSSLKNPDWLAEEIVGAAAKRTDVTVRIRSGAELERFGGLRAVGGASVFPPCLVEMSRHPAGATRHVVLVGKGITFDSGGISIKTRPGMKTMKIDMAGAAAVVAATLGASDLNLPVRVTALLPLAENAVGADAYRPGDVITHYDGTTSESTNSDAEGRLVLADALGYAVAELDPDVIVDLATLTGANAIALGPRIAALFSHDDELAGALQAAGASAGEAMWRMPLPDDYCEYLRSEIADRHSSPAQGAGAVVAALYLREFLGDQVSAWAHLDMAAPSWADETDLDLTRGATGWGARTLLRYLETVSASPR